MSKKPSRRLLGFPIVDTHRRFGFDIFRDWQDVYLRSPRNFRIVCALALPFWPNGADVVPVAALGADRYGGEAMGACDMASADREEPKPALSPQDMEEMAKYGIIRVPVDYFYCGAFRYTNLKDAIAQARRFQHLD